MDAKTVLEKYWDGKLPIDVDSIAKRIGIIFKSNDALTDDESGYIRLSEDGKVICVINENHSKTRQRFTTAHEIGHFVLGHLNGKKKLYRDAKNVNVLDSREVEANNFAAQLLMPDTIIDFLIYEENLTSVAKLARKFNVSEDSMRYRLKNLGLI